MTAITSETHPAPAKARLHKSSLLGDLNAFWRQFFHRAFDPYRPELHYMRGPGPAWRAKHVTPSRHST